MSHLSDYLDDVKTWTAFRLSSEADCMSPDSADSEGARFLGSVRNEIVEAIEQADADDLENLDDDGSLHEIADNAPDYRTHTRWQEFVDLGGYQEDISEYGDYGDDLTRAAGVALFMIADKLVRAIVDGAIEAHGEDADETEEDEDEEA